MQGETDGVRLDRLGTRVGRENFPVSVFYPLCEHLVEGWEQVPVAIQSHGDAGVAQSLLDGLGVRADADS